MKTITNIIVLITVVSLLSSCRSQKFLTSKVEGNASELLRTGAHYEHIIKTDDKVSVSIWNHSDYSLGSVYTIHNTNESYGKWILVDKEGNIPLPEIGEVKLAGLTCMEAQILLKEKYGKKLVDPIVAVRVLNKEISVLGEVTQPGNYLLEKESTNITEALGKADGFTNYSNLKKVQLIRGDTLYNLNFKTLNESALHKILVRSGDIIVVPERKSKRINMNSPTLIAVSSAVTAMVLVITLVSTGN